MIKAEVNFKDVAEKISKLNTSELPFAISRGLNDTAFSARKYVAGNIPKRFDLKSKYIQRGVRVDKSNKYNLRAIVFHLDEFMEKQEFGGTENASGKLINVKTKIHRGRAARVAMSKYASVLTKDYKGPRDAGKKGGRGNKGKGRTKFFSYENNRYGFIARRKTRGKKRFGRGNSIYAFILTKQVKNKPMLKLREDVTKVAKHIGPNKIAKTIDSLS